jgi:WD40 repeat protein
MAMRRRGIGTTALVALVAFAAACTSTPPRPGDTGGPSYRPTGRMVSFVGQFGGHLAVTDLATGKSIDTTMPPVFGSWEGVWPGPGGRFYAMPLVFDATAGSQLYLQGGKRPPQRIGPPVNGVIGFQAAAGYAVAWSCPGVFVMDLSDPTRWERVSSGCGAAVSPDGRRLAFATESSLWVTDLPDGTPREVLRFADLPELRRTHTPPSSLEQVAWGAGGVAVAVGDTSQGAVVIWDEDRPPVVDVLGRARFGEMQWQPGGDLLAFVDYAPDGELFELDPRTGEERQLAAVGDVRGLVWSPDGRVVSAALSQNIVTLVDPAAGPVGTLTTPGIPVAWFPEEG